MIRDCIDVLHAVTSSLSLVLLRGQLGYLKAAGFCPAALSSPGPRVDDMRAEEHIPVFTVQMQREISPARDLLSLLLLWRLLRRLRPAICNVGTPKAGLLVGLAAWFNRVPCRIYTLRGLRLETATGAKRRILHLTERIACACAHRVVCVSPSLRQRVVEFGLVRWEKTVILGSGSSNGIDCSRFAPTPDKIARANEIGCKLGIEPGHPVVGYIGRFTRDKGVPELLTAFRSVRQRFPDARLLLIGSYEQGDPVPPETRAAIDNDPGVMHIDFTPDTAPYYLLMDVFVLPTHREGFPNTVLEAQAARRPVVTTRATGATDAVCHGVTGFVVPVNDAAAMADALGVLLSDRGLAERMGRAGYERVSKEFQQEIIWKELLVFYRDLMTERGLPVPVTLSAEDRMCVKEQ